MTTVTNNPTASSNQSFVGASAGWVNTNNVFTSNNVVATCNLTTSQSIFDNEVKLVVGYDIEFSIFQFSTLSKASGGTYPSADAYTTYGSAVDRWNYYLTPPQINAAFTFGLALSCKDGNATPLTTDYLVAHTYGFSIPNKASISGVTARIEKRAVFSSRTGQTTISVDHMELTVDYDLFYPQGQIISWLAPLLAKVCLGVTATGLLGMFGICGVEYKDGFIIKGTQTRTLKLA